MRFVAGSQIIALDSDRARLSQSAPPKELSRFVRTAAAPKVCRTLAQPPRGQPGRLRTVELQMSRLAHALALALNRRAAWVGGEKGIRLAARRASRLRCADAGCLTGFPALLGQPQGKGLIGDILKGLPTLHDYAVLVAFDPKLDGDPALLALLFAAAALALSHLCSRIERRDFWTTATWFYRVWLFAFRAWHWRD